ncbi:MAG: glycosyltransferase family 4 protein [Planctomycetota bacterium]
MDGRETILFLHPTPDRYGADVALLELVRGLDQARWRPVVAVPGEGPLVALLKAAGAEVEDGPLGVLDRRTLRSPLRLLRFAINVPRAALFVRRLVRRHRPAVIHTNTAIVIGGAIGARLTRTRHLWHLHEIISHPKWAARVLARCAARLADVVVSNSRATRESFDRYSPELAARHRVVLNGVDARRLTPNHAARNDAHLGTAEARAEARRSLAVDDEAALIVLVGRVNTWKGQRLLLDAAERLRFRHPDARFLLVGDAPPGHGALVAALRTEIQARNFAGYVEHLPHQTDIGRILRAADIVVVPSTQPEPFGLVAVEAMAMGRPVIAAAHGGIVEVVDSGVTGLLFEPNDAAKLAWALQVLIEDRSRAREMGRRGRERYEAHFTSERMLREMDQIWSQLVERPFLLSDSDAQIVHFVLGKANPERLNGVNHVVHGLATAQAARGLDVSVFGITPDPAAPTPERAYDLRLFQARGSRLGLQGPLDRSLVEALNALPPTALAHLHGGYVPTMRAISRALTRRRIPFVFTPHGAYRALARQRSGLRKRLYGALYERKLVRDARAVQAFSVREGEEMTDLVDAHKVVVIPIGQDAPDNAELAALASEARELAADVRRPLYGYCGRLAAFTKGLDALLDAFALHVAGEGEGTLWLIGEGEDRAALEARARDLGIERRVAFQGARFGREKLTHLAALDVFVHPSRHEGMPTSVLECAALGRPVVVTAETNLAEAVHEAGAGIALQHADKEQLAAALAAIEREWRAGTLSCRGEAALAMVRTRFAWRDLEPLISAELYELEHHLATDHTRGAPACAPDGQRRSA